MTGDQALGWLVSALFAGFAVWYAVVLALSLGRRESDRAGQVSSALHVLMCAAMVGMFWSWGAAVPAIAQVTFFTAAAAWFAGRALFSRPAAQWDQVARLARPAAAASADRLSWYHAGMMTAMAWMAIAMSAVSVPVAAGAGAMAGMAGMAAGQATTASTSTVASATIVGSAPAWVVAVCVGGAVLFLAAAAWQVIGTARALAAARTVAASRRPFGSGALVPRSVSALMAAGMAVTLLLMT